ncbi:hypothetical protein Q3G72_009034 [Acer saccharum]|nr:hypothetical protein Q3G72_009034 [Acer saccharum]
MPLMIHSLQSEKSPNQLPWPSRYHPTRSFLVAVHPSSDRRAAASLQLSSSSLNQSLLHKAHFQSFRNITGNPEVRVLKEKRAAGVLDNFVEGERY